MSESEYSEVVCFKLTVEGRQKLELMAERTQRTMSQVVRLLVEQAEVPEAPDIQFRLRYADDRQPQPA